jgi:hypothetical protein
MKKAIKWVVPGVLIGLVAFAAPAQTAVEAWTPNMRLFASQGQSLQSEPSTAVGGAGANSYVVAWTDERNTVPDIYMNTWNGVTPVVANQRASDLSGDTPTEDAASAAVMDTDGRAFIAYSTIQNIVLARRETNGSVISTTLASGDPIAWYAHARRPSLVSNGSADLVVIWQSFRNEQWDIYSAKCNGNTMICAAPVLVNNDGTASTAKNQIKPRIARNGNTIMAVWQDDRETGAQYPHVYSSISTNAGASWGANVRVDATYTKTSAALAPAVAIDPSNGAIYAVWEQHNGLPTSPADVYVAQWNGSAWASHARVDAAPAGARAIAPDIAIGSAGRFVSWEDYRNGNANADIYGARWNGSAWAEHIVSAQVGQQVQPSLGVNGANARISWQDNRSGHWDIYTARWNGSAWADEAQVNENPQTTSYQNAPALLAVGNGDFWLMWMDNRDHDDLFYASKYAHASQAWGNAIQLPGGEGWHGVMNNTPAIALDASGRLHALWAENNAGSDGQMRIFYSVLSGTVWSPEVQVSDNLTSTIWTPNTDPAVDYKNGRMSAVWSYQHGDENYTWPPTYTVYASFWNSATQAWSPQTQVNTETLRGDPKPSIAIDSAGNTFVAWASVQYTGGAMYGNVRIAKYPAGGGGWTQYRTINSVVSPNEWCYQHNPQLKIDAQDHLHVVWTGCQSWLWAGYYALSTDGGNTWSPSPAPAINDFDSNTFATLALGGGASPELTVVYPRSTADGYRFFSARNITGTWQIGLPVSDGPTNWIDWQNGRAATAYDPVSKRFFSAFTDKRLGLPQIYGTWLYAGQLKKIFLPSTMRAAGINY